MTDRILKRPLLCSVQFAVDQVVLASWADGAVMVVSARSRNDEPFGVRCCGRWMTTANFQVDPSGRILVVQGVGTPKKRTTPVEQGELNKWKWFWSAAFPPGHNLHDRWMTQDFPSEEGELGPEFEFYHLLGEVHPAWSGDDDLWGSWVDSLVPERTAP